MIVIAVPYILCAAILSFFIGLFGVFVSDWKAVMANGLFQGYQPVVIVVIILQVSRPNGVQ